MSEVKVSKQDQLKAKNAEAKALAAERKALREEVNASKGERSEARTEQAATRKAARAFKSELAKMTASVNDVFKSGNSEAIIELADAISNKSAELSGAIRKFGEAQEQLQNI